MLREYPRILVVGASGSGKTTFGRRIAELLGRRHIEIDSLYWGPHWQARADFRESLLRELGAAEWVADGNYGSARDILWARASALVWLNYSFPVVFSQVLRRTVSRLLSGETLFAGNKESFRSAFLSRDSVILYSAQSYPRYRREYPELLARPEFRHLHVFNLRSRREADALLQLEAAARDTTQRAAPTSA